jgi:hypothetical protein
MTDDSLKIFRDVIAMLHDLHKTLRQRRRQLVQVVGEGVEIEMISARCGFAIKQLQDARDLYAKLTRSDEEPPNVENITLTLSERGHEIRRRTEEDK